MYQTCKRLDSDDSFQSLPLIYFSWILFKRSVLLLQTFLLVKLVLMQIWWLMRIDAMGLEFPSSQCFQWLTDYDAKKTKIYILIILLEVIIQQTPQYFGWVIQLNRTVACWTKACINLVGTELLRHMKLWNQELKFDKLLSLRAFITIWFRSQPNFSR